MIRDKIVPVPEITTIRNFRRSVDCMNTALVVDIYGNANSTQLFGLDHGERQGGSEISPPERRLGGHDDTVFCQGGEISRVVPLVPQSIIRSMRSSHRDRSGTAYLRGLDPR
jgi:acyl-CoA hydrolase